MSTALKIGLIKKCYIYQTISDLFTNIWIHTCSFIYKLQCFNMYTIFTIFTIFIYNTRNYILYIIYIQYFLYM